jgi:ribonuclease R
VPKRIRRRRHLETHRLIEEFMIAANRAVGEWAHEWGAPFLYRVHQEPDVRALARFEETVLTIQPGTPPGELASLPRIRRWLAALPRTPVGLLLHRFFLRSLKKAVYAPVDVGHFGLGIRGYCHFTSPIRRYPDLFDHRRVKELLDGGKDGDRWEQAAVLALSCSRAEVNGEEAEREMVQLKAIRFMERRLGEEAAGHVTGLTPQGLFVELDSIPVEGFVPREALPGGMRFEGDRMAWVEARSGGEIRPGDPVKVQVARCDLRTRRVEFVLLKAPRGPQAGGGRSRREKPEAPPVESRGKPRGRKARGPRAGGRRGARTGRPGRSTRPGRTVRTGRTARPQGKRRGK